MSPAGKPTKAAVAPAPVARIPGSGNWILTSWQDLVLFVATPVFIVPGVLLLQSRLPVASLEMVAILVAGFGALGHHFPGIIPSFPHP